MSKNILTTVGASFSRLARDERGAETIESVMILGFIVVLCLFAIAAVGRAIQLRWNDILNWL